MSMATLRRAVLRFLGDERGSITVEFMIWIPILMFWIVFSLAVFMAMDSRSDAAKAAYTVADIVSRQDQVDQAFVTDLQTLTEDLLATAADGSTMRVSSIIFEDGDLNVQWSECFGGIAALTDETIPIEIMPTMANLDTIILTETYVPYLPISNAFGALTSRVWMNRVVIRPRFIAAITNDDAPSGSCL